MTLNVTYFIAGFHSCCSSRRSLKKNSAIFRENFKNATCPQIQDGSICLARQHNLLAHSFVFLRGHKCILLKYSWQANFSRRKKGAIIIGSLQGCQRQGLGANETFVENMQANALVERNRLLSHSWKTDGNGSSKTQLKIPGRKKPIDSAVSSSSSLTEVNL